MNAPFDDRASQEFGPEFAPRRHPGTTSVELDGEVVAYRDGAMHRLDRIATMLWNAFDGSTTLGELADDLSAVYSEPRDKILGDIVACVAELSRQGLLAPDHEH